MCGAIEIIKKFVHRLHYETMPDYAPHMSVPGPPQMCPGPYAGPPPGSHYPPYPSPEFSRVEPDVPKGSFFNGVSAPPPRQKGRPRKKKPKDQDLMTANLGKFYELICFFNAKWRMLSNFLVQGIFISKFSFIL